MRWDHSTRVKMYSLLVKESGISPRNGSSPEREVRLEVAQQIGCSLSALDAQINNVKMDICCSEGNERTYSFNVHAALEAGFITLKSEQRREAIYGKFLIPMQDL
ncbi:hypothetical protein [Moritella sp. F3]|uniref:hypothetical protein n=1 Tax=Moritella sp. F3 TaxID=2718882 RepID=UPI0018E18827|nr:hypothetical protein [Moritella sp. F3]GIC75608.1 hypothetical protein FMO001_03350 [Moritella sp. F1]GIC80753.1 hypothetical protein FMO003_10340 [Moritella sp. F3]